MPKFGKRSKSNLKDVDRRLVKLFKAVVEDYDCTVLVGHRGEEAQNRAYKEKKSYKKWPEGKHNSLPSKAVDVAPWPIPNGWGKTRDDLEKFRYFAFYVIGMGKGMGYTIRWGGDWDSDKDVTDNKFNDLVHFEILH